MAHEGHSENVVDPTAQLNTFHHIPLGLIVWHLRDASDVRSLRVLAVNEAAERELATPLRNAIGKEIAEALPSLLKTSLPDRCRRVIVSGRPETAGEVRFSGARVEDRAFRFDCFPLPGNCVGIAFENITNWKKSEQAKADALQAARRCRR
jgi:hypothetical protein